MTLLIWIKQLVKWLVLPPGGPLLLGLAGIAMTPRCPRAGKALMIVCVATLLLLSMPAVGGFLIRCLDRTPALDPSQVGKAQAIVILSGGTRRNAPEYGGPTLGTIALERIRYGARLARETGLPVLVSGGRVRQAPPEALLMRDVLTREFGVPVRWVETRSQNTHQNAINSAAILKASGVQQVILVGHSFDFPRTRIEFEAAGIDAIPAPIDIPPTLPTVFGDFLPSASGLQLSHYALYEILANALYRGMHWNAAEQAPAPRVKALPAH